MNNANSEDIKGKQILAIDYGTKVVGLASFSVGRDPFPLCHGRIIFTDEAQVIKELKEHIEEDFFDLIVLGLPLFTDGTESKMTKTVKKFAHKLEVSLKLPLFLQDETLSSFEAEERMKNSPKYNFKVDLKKIDELAASIILEDFLAAIENGAKVEL